MDEKQLKLLQELMEKSNKDMVSGIEVALSKAFCNGKSNNPIAEGEEKKSEHKGFTGKHYKQLGDFAIAVKRFETTKEIDQRLIIKDSNAQGMNEADPSAGGFLVQQDISEALIESAQQTGILLPRCNRFPVSPNNNGIRFNAIDETSRADGSRQGGVLAYWEGEADQITKSKPKFREVNMRLNKLTGLCYVTDELLQDSVFLGAFLARSFANEFGFKIDDAIINGTGAGMPLGLINSPGLYSIAKETDQPGATILFNNVVKMYNSMPFRNRGNAVWICNPEVEDQLPSLKLEGDTGMWPAYLPPGGLSSAPYGLLRGRPVIPVEQCAALGTKGDLMFVDFSDYYIIEKGNLESAMSIHLRFDYNETAFRWTLRLNGQHIRNAALAPYKGSKKLSTAISLDTRS